LNITLIKKPFRFHYTKEVLDNTSNTSSQDKTSTQDNRNQFPTFFGK